RRDHEGPVRPDDAGPGATSLYVPPQSQSTQTQAVSADHTSHAAKASRHTIENARTAWYVRAMRRWASRRASGKTVIHKRRPAKNPTTTAGPSWLIRTSPAVSHQRIG